MSFREGRVGYLGSTSFSAVFRDSGDLTIVDDGTDESELPPVPAEKIRQSADVLALLRDIPIHLKFTERCFDLCDGIIVIQPVYKIWVDELWREFGPLLVQSDPEQLRMLAEMVWRNTRRTMKVPGNMSFAEWAKSNTGRGLRWEVVGIVCSLSLSFLWHSQLITLTKILSMSGITSVNLHDWDSIFDVLGDAYPNKTAYVERMFKASEYCLCFCYECETLNDLYISFMLKDLALVECTKGDAHYAAWQRTGELCDAVVAMGLHQGNSPDAHTPFWLAEYRKKLFISAYSRDKSTATFLGRPPRLSHRYCKLEVPLDLSDEQLFMEGPELDAVLRQLDDKGWNTAGNLHRTTWLRVWFQHWRIREDILEIALGSEVNDILTRAQQIRDDLEVLHDAFPHFMKVEPEAVFSMNSREILQLVGPYGRAAGDKTMKHVATVFTIYVRLGVLHTELLLLRALVNRKQAEYRDLIPVSRRILSIVLLAFSNREVFRDFWLDLTYILASHGIPSAGVLAIELLKQEQTKQHTPDILPRSETIQDISVFISCLASIGPSDGNYYICDQGRRSLRKVLDQILAPHPLPMVVANEQQPLFEEMNLSFPTGNDADFLQWLENVEWDKPQPLNVHP